MKRSDWRDYVIRVVLLVSGALAAVLLTLNGYCPALPALTIGAVLGNCFVTGLESGHP